MSFPLDLSMPPDISMEMLSSKGVEIVNKILANIPPFRGLDVAVGCAALWAFVKLVRMSRRRLFTTRLRGPRSPSFVFGLGYKILDSDDSGSMYEAWAQEYGPAYEVPSTLGRTRIVLCDPKAIAHYYGKESTTYRLTGLSKNIFHATVGKGLLWADGESHKRQRRSLTPAFSIAAIRRMSAIFSDSAYKTKAAWEAIIGANGGDDAIIDVQNWMNHISIDSIGITGFSHDFGTLEGNHTSVTEIFDKFNTSPRYAAMVKVTNTLGLVFPFITQLPTPRTRLLKRLNDAMQDISNTLLARTKEEMEMEVVGEKGDRSIIGLLIKGGSGNSEFRLTQDEVMAQMKTLLVAGYETTSISMTWGLIELARKPHLQTRLRNELLEHGEDPTYDELASGLPFLDAVVHETLRLHPAFQEFTRVAGEDDVLPFSEPVRTKSGELVENLSIAKGTLVCIPLECINRSTAIWGDDAKEFNPSRWLEDEHGKNGIPAKAKEVQGHRHLLTFVDGPRTCLGKNFAVSEFKAVMAVLIKNFVFEFPNGPDTKIQLGRGLLVRPQVAGEVGCKVPLRVRPYAG